MESAVVKRSVAITGHKTSVSLEDKFWAGLKFIAGEESLTLSELLATIDERRKQGNLSSAIRLFVLDYFISLIPSHEQDNALPRHLAPPRLDEDPADRLKGSLRNWPQRRDS